MNADKDKIFRIIVDYHAGYENLNKINGQLQKVKLESKELAKAEKELIKQYKDGVISEDEYSAKIKENGVAMEKNRRSLISLSAERQRATAENKRLVVSETSAKGSMIELSARLTTLRMRYRELSEEQRKNTAVGGVMLKQIKQMSAEHRKLEMTIGNTNANVGNYPRMLVQAQGVVAWGMSLVYAAEKLITPFKDFEYQMSKVKAISGATDEEFQRLEADALRLGKSTEYTSSQVAELQVAYARLGFSASEIIKVTDATLQLATATGEDLARSADIAGATLRGFALPADKMLDVVDVMAESFNRSALDLNTFAESMKYVAPIAENAGVSLEQTSAMLAILSDRGIRGSQAGTALRRILTEISISGKSVSEALADLNKKGLTVAGAMDEVGRYAMTALTVLAKNTSQIDDMTIALENSAGAAAATADIMRDNLKGDIDKLSSAVEGAAIWFGDVFSFALRGVTQLLTFLVGPLRAVIAVLGTYIVTLKVATAVSVAARAVKVALNATTTSEILLLSGLTKAQNAYIYKLISATALTKSFGVAKLLLTGQIKAATVAMRLFFASMGPVGWVITAVTAAATLTAAAFAALSGRTKEVSESSVALSLQLANEKKQHGDLLNAVLNSEKGSKVRIEAIKQINELYGQYLPHLLTDASSNLEISNAMALANEKLEENIRLKYLQEETGKIRQKQFDAEKEALMHIMRTYAELENRTAEQTALAQAQAINAIRAFKETGDSVKFVADMHQILKDEASGSSKAIKYGWMGDISTLMRDIEDSAKAAVFELNLVNAMAGTAAVVSDQMSKMSLEAMQSKLSTIDADMEKGLNSYGQKYTLIERENLEEQRRIVAERIVLKSKEIEAEKNKVQTYAEYLKQLQDEKAKLEAEKATINKNDAKAIAAKDKAIQDKQAEIDALTGANKKGLDKQASQAEKAAEARQKLLAENNKSILDLENNRIDTEIALMADGYDKKLRLQEHAEKKAIDKLGQDGQKAIRETEKQQKGLSKDSEPYKALDGSKERLMQGYEDNLTAITDAGAVERFKIYATMSAAELEVLRQGWQQKAEASTAGLDEMERLSEITYAQSLMALDQSEADKLALIKEWQQKQRDVVEVKAKTDGAIRELEAEYELRKRINNDTITDDNKRRDAHLKNEIEIRKAKADTYLAQVEAMNKLGVLDEASYNNAIAYAKKLQKELEDIASGKTTVNEDGGTASGGNFFQRAFDFKSMSDDQKQQLKQQAIDLAREIGQSVIDIQTEISQRRLKNEQKRIDNERDVEIKSLEDKRRKGLISEKEYQRGMEAANKEADAKREAAERAAFEREKKLRIMGVWMDVASGIVKTLAQNVFPLTAFAIADIAMLGAAGIAQTAVIASQKYERGGIVPIGNSGDGISMGQLKGPSHAAGGMRIYLEGSDIPIGEMEGDEILAVINKRSAAKYMPQLSAINQAGGGSKFALGGVIPRPAGGFIPRPAAVPNYRQMFEAQQTQAMMQEIGQMRLELSEFSSRMVEYVDQKIGSLKVVVVESDITETQAAVKKVQVKAKF